MYSSVSSGMWDRGDCFEGFIGVRLFIWVNRSDLVTCTIYCYDRSFEQPWVSRNFCSLKIKSPAWFE